MAARWRAPLRPPGAIRGDLARLDPEHPRLMAHDVGRAQLSVATGNSPQARGFAVETLLRSSPPVDAVLSVTVEEGLGAGRYPVVQRILRLKDEATGGAFDDSGTRGATGDPQVILRQDLLSVIRALHPAHVVLALPGNVELLPFLVGLWEHRDGRSSLPDRYATGPVVHAIDPAVFRSDLDSVRTADRLWTGAGRGEPLTPAEAAVRQVEAADWLIASHDPLADGTPTALLHHLNPAARLITPAGPYATDRRLSVPSPVRSASDPGTWEARLDPLAVPRRPAIAAHGVGSLLWRTRRPLHPGRLAEVLGGVLAGVVRSRGHLWLATRPDDVISWRSAGSHLQLQPTERWLLSGDPRWTAVHPQRRVMASWYWHDYFGERRNELVFTGTSLDGDRVLGAMNSALLTDAELILGPEAWTTMADPLLGDAPL
ncbi:GTP-binding protein [Actinacidiphila alni]|uniref:GTP-binding protein n=1 Tax=Actinacidiphila alni TaxID=380248 RepID=UPI0033EB7E06